MFWLIGLAVVGVAGYAAYATNMLCGMGLCASSGAVGTWGTPGVAFIPTPGTQYYLGVNTNDVSYSAFPLPNDPYWMLTGNTSGGLNQWTPGSGGAPPPVGPPAWLAVYRAGYPVVIASYSGPPNTPAASFLTSYGQA